MHWKSIKSFFWKEYYLYEFDGSESALKNTLDALFTKTDFWDFSINLAREFTSNAEFQVIPKWQFATFSGTERMVAYLNGKIVQREPERTSITVTVRPNRTSLLLAAMLPLAGLLISLEGQRISEVERLFGVLFSFAFSVLLLVISYSNKQALRNRFVKYVGLRPLPYTDAVVNGTVSSRQPDP